MRSFFLRTRDFVENCAIIHLGVSSSWEGGVVVREVVPKEGVKYRAVMMGIVTGDMPDTEFIWARQRDEGQEACFGRVLGCEDRDCRWRQQCLALGLYKEVKVDASVKS